MRNEVFIEGNLTRDAELKYTNSGTALLKFSIAYNDNYIKDGHEIKDVSYFDVTAWKELAEDFKWLTKGIHIQITGKLKQDRWEKDGKTQSRVGITAFSLNTEHKEGIAKNGDSIPF